MLGELLGRDAFDGEVIIIRYIRLVRYGFLDLVVLLDLDVAHAFDGHVVEVTDSLLHVLVCWWLFLFQRIGNGLFL